MCHRLKRHPIAMRAFFEHSLVLTYAYPSGVLRKLLPPGLELDTLGPWGFAAAAMVQTRDLRPAFLPRWLGARFFLAGYRIFVRHRDRFGRTRRGLFIMRSDTDRRSMRFFGNLLTHYNYHVVNAEVTASDDVLRVVIASENGASDLEIQASLGSDPWLPADSPFSDFRDARRFAGPLPYTFDYEVQTHSIIRIKGVRDRWEPKCVPVRVKHNAFMHGPQFEGCPPLLASAFHVRDVSYLWQRGVRESLGCPMPGLRVDRRAASC